MDTVVTSLVSLYKELGGTKEVSDNITTTGALSLVAERFGYDGPIPDNPTVSDIVRLLTSVMALSDTTIIPFSQETIFGYNTSDLQEDLEVSSDKITGKLNFLDSGELVDAHGEGYFFAVEFDEKDADATSIKMGMYPTFKNGEFVYDDSGLSDAINDPDKGGAWKVTNKNTQYFKVITSDGTKIHSQLFDLSAFDLIPPADDSED